MSCIHYINHMHDCFRQMWPFLWPRGKPWLQLRVIVCCLILVAQRVVNIAIPLLYKLIGQ